MNDYLICVPTYNESENIERLVSEVLDATDNHDILVIDDNSPDGTGEIAARLSDETDAVHVLHRKGKAGLGKAYLAGFDWALERDYEGVFEMDADFSHQPKYLQPMTEKLEEADVVVGSRYVEGGGTKDWGVLRKIVSRFGSLYARTILGLDIKDLTGGFVAWRKATLEALDLDEVTSSGYVFQIEMKYRAYRKGFKIEEIPIVFPDRVRGESKMTADIAAEAVVQTVKLRMRV
jgi:dolichol-phosphate mannosyltransferase